MKVKNNLKFWAVGVFLLSFCLYYSTLPTTNVGYGDSDLLIALGFEGGVAHPPGYPLFVALTWIMTHLPLPLTIASRAHLLSVMLSSAALTVLYLSVHLTLEKLTKVRWLKLISLLSISTLIILPPFWLYSIIAEKYALNLFVASLLIYFSLKLLTQPPSHLSYYLYLFLFGVSLTTHLTLWFLLPMVGFTLYHRRPKLKSMIALILGLLLPLALLWLLNLRTSPTLSWHFPVTLPGFIHHAAMLDYFTRSTEARPLSPTLLNSLLGYLKYLSLSYGLVPLLIAVSGLYFLTKKPQSPLKSLLLIGTIFTLILLPFIVRWPLLYSGQATAQRQYLIGYLFLPIIFSLGLASFLKVINKRTYQVFTLVLIVLLLMTRLVYFYPQLNLKTDTQFTQYYQTLLAKVPSNTRFFCFTDVSCFALFYNQEILHQRPDVTVIPEAYEFVTKPLPRLSPDYIKQTLLVYPIRLIDLPQKYYDSLRIDSGQFYLSPEDQALAVSLTATPAASLTKYPYTDYLLQTRYLSIDPVRRQRLAGDAQRHLVSAMTAALRQDSATFKLESNYAQKLTDKLGEPYQSSVQTVLNLYSQNPYPKLPL